MVIWDSNLILLLRKAGAYNESKHPRRPKGSGENAGQFAPKGGGEVDNTSEVNHRSSVEEWHDSARAVGFNDLNARLLANGLRTLDVPRARMHLVMRRAKELFERAAGDNQDGRTSLSIWSQLKAELPHILQLKTASAVGGPHLDAWLDFVLLQSARKAFDESKHPRQPAGSDKGGEFAPKGASTSAANAPDSVIASNVKKYKSPKMPPIKFNGTAGEVAKRANERARLMEAAHPGVKFSSYVPNPLGYRAGRKEGVPGIGEPGALMNFKATPLENPAAERLILAAAKKWGGPAVHNFVTTNTLKIASGLSYPELFGVLKFMQQRDPRSITWSVDRLGHPTRVGFRGAILK